MWTQVAAGGVVSGGLGVLACFVLPISLVSGWTKAVVTDTDSYVSTVAPLADDPDVQQFVITRLTDAIEGRVDLSAQEQKVQQALTDRGNTRLAALIPVLRGMAQQLAGQAVESTVTRLVESPEFSDAWKAANRSAHIELVEILSGDPDAIISSDGRVSIQLATLVNSVVAQLAAQGYPLAGQIPTLEASIPLLKTADIQKAQHGYNLIRKAGWWLPVLFLLLTVATILLARDRRRTVFWLAAGFTVGVILLSIGLKVAHHLLLGALPPDIDAAVTNAVWTTLIADLRHAIQLTLVVSLIALVVSWVAGPGGGPAWIRDHGRAAATAATDRTDTGEGSAVIVVVGAVVAVAALIWLV